MSVSSAGGAFVNERAPNESNAITKIDQNLAARVPLTRAAKSALPLSQS